MSGAAVAELGQDRVGVLAERAAPGGGSVPASRRDRPASARAAPAAAARDTRCRPAARPRGCARPRAPAAASRAARPGSCAFSSSASASAVVRSAGPLRHPLGDELAVVAARLVVLEARVGQPVLLAHQLRPAREHRVADRVGDDPAVLRAEEVGRRRGLAAVDGGDAVGLDDLLLDQGRVVEGDRGAQQRALDLLAAARSSARAMSAASVPNAASDAVPQSTHATAARSGCSGVPVRYARAAHHLADAVEAVLVAPRARRRRTRSRW